MDGKSSSRILPVEGGRTMTSIPLPRSESAGGAVRSPEGDPPRRRGQNREGGDAGGRATPDRQPLAVAAIVGNPTVHPDEGVEFTLFSHSVIYRQHFPGGRNHWVIRLVREVAGSNLNGRYFVTYLFCFYGPVSG